VTEKKREKTLAELKIGDTIEGPLPPTYNLVSLLPETVAQTWVLETTPDAVITRTGYRASETTIFKWEPGLGIIVGAITTNILKDTERLNVIYRSANRLHLLYLSPPRSKIV